MKRILNVLSPKRLLLYALLLATLMTVVICLPSCKEEKSPEQPILLINDENNPPVSLTFHRKAEGRYVTGYTEADNMSVTMQMKSKTAESIYAWLTHFTVGEEITEPESYSPFYFTVKYEKGEEVHFGFYDCEIEGKKYAIEFTEGAIGTEGEKEWRELMANSLNAYTDLNFDISAKFKEGHFVYHATSAESYVTNGYTTDKFDDTVFLPMTGPAPENIPSDLAAEIDLSTLYPRLVMTELKQVHQTTIISFDPLLVLYSENVLDTPALYQMSPLPELTEKDGRIVAMTDTEAFSTISTEIKAIHEEREAAEALIPTIDDPDYDWSDHIFPQPEGTEIVKVEFSRNAYGVLATGIDEIDRVSVDVTDFQGDEEHKQSILKEAAAKLRHVKYGEEVPSDTVASVNYSYAITATYADGKVIRCEFPFATKDGKKYSIDGLSNIESILHTSNGGVSLILREQFSILRELNIGSNAITNINALMSVDGTTRRLLNKDGSIQMTLPPTEQLHGLPYYDGCDAFSVEITAPSDLDYAESLVIESADKKRSATCYGGSCGVIRYEDNGVVTWHRTHLLNDADSKFYYTDILISDFKRQYSADVLNKQ